VTIGAEAWSLLQSVISGLIGAGVVYYFGIRQLVAQRRLAFVERQLVEFYAPLTGFRKQIRAKSELVSGCRTQRAQLGKISARPTKGDPCTIMRSASLRSRGSLSTTTNS